MTSGLQDALERLYGLERRRDKLGLEGTRVLLAALGDPHRRFRSVHVAGTNGKGTVCALVERVLREAGYRCGLFTSPHLVDFRERIRVNGRWADEEWLDGRLRHLQDLPEGRDRTFFEVCTALAFDYFADRGVEIAVVEVGLGGRLDCTNVLTPEVSVITSIGLDHTEILGGTIEEIAAEKAGIVKPGIPLVAGALDPAARRVIEETARARGAPIERPELAWRSDPSRGAQADQALARALGTASADGLEIDPVTRERFGENLATAVGALAALRRRGVRLPMGAVAEGLARARWPGRLEACPKLPRLWWDGAHNAQGVQFLSARWMASRGKGPAATVLALSRDKDARAMVTALRSQLEVSRMVVTRARTGRAQEPEALAAIAAELGVEVEQASSVVAAVRRALEWSGDGDVLLTGSLFAVGEAMERWGGAPGEWQ